jgi:hypothetical protein
VKGHDRIIAALNDVLTAELCGRGFLKIKELAKAALRSKVGRQRTKSGTTAGRRDHPGPGPLLRRPLPRCMQWRCVNMNSIPEEFEPCVPL